MSETSLAQTPPPDSENRPALTEDRLALLINLSPLPVTRDTIRSSFAPYDGIDRDITQLLTRLSRKNALWLVKRGRTCIPSHPWADVAYATVPEDLPDNGSVTLPVRNLPNDAPVRVFLSRSQIDKHHLRPGDTILCRLARPGPGFGLRALVLERLNRGNRSRLSGYFNDRSGGAKFTAGNAQIKTAFNLRTWDGGAARMQHREVCFVELPDDFDVRTPTAVLLDGQQTDADTGRNIDDVLVESHKLDRPWPDAIIEEARTLAAAGPDPSGRRIVTGVTIDGENPAEIDDMIWAERSGNGGFITRTSIADVASLVLPGTDIDHEAKARGTTIYLRDREIGMLPTSIARGTGSLLPGTERLAICIEIEYDRDLSLVRTDIFPALARSTAAYSYGEFGVVLITDPALTGLQEFNEQLSRGSALQTLGRNGSLEETGSSHSLVQYFMLQANTAIAEFLQSRHAIIPYRNNGITRNPTLYAETRSEIARLGLEMPEDPDACTSGVQIDLLRQAAGTGAEAEVRLLLRQAADRSYYDMINRGHFDLRRRAYVRGTSPLRRYSDLQIQRALHLEFSKRNPEFARFAQTDAERKRMPDTIAHLNELDDVTRSLEGDRQRYHLLRDLKTLEGKTMLARLHHVNGARIELLLPGLGLRRQFRASQLPEYSCRLDPERHTLVFGDEKSVTQGAMLRIRIGSVRPHQARWDCHILEPA